MLPIKTDVWLKDYSNFKIGGKSSYFVEVYSTDEIAKAIEEWKKISKSFPKDKQKTFILGGGTNILFSDKGFEGLIVKNSITGITKTSNGIKVGAGELVSDILDFCIDNSLSGLEWAGGLPGTIGGAVRGNAGAFKGEIKDNILSVESINLDDNINKSRNNKECNFEYRSSIFKNLVKNEIITYVEITLSAGDKNQIQNQTQEKINYRNEKHPMEFPSIGSTFKNIPVDNLSDSQKSELLDYVKDDPFPVIPVAKLLFLCGLKGKREGNAQISDKHPNFIVNLGDATNSDVKNLIKFAKNAVFQRFGIKLEEEIIYVGD